MIAPSDSCDVLIVGGGPAGSTCAWQLRQHGVDVQILDRAVFPRDKVCAGWITPQLVESLALDRDEYRDGRVLQPITGFQVGLIGSEPLFVPYGMPVSYGIRRREFDEYLLRRSGVPVHEGVAVRSVRRDEGEWLINDRWRAPLLIGAGGHFCPVARYLRAQNQTASEPHVVMAQEAEYQLTGTDLDRCRIEPGVPQLYFCADLKGYAWCIRKGDWLNIGIGREGERNLSHCREEFVQWLVGSGRMADPPRDHFKGHAYRLDCAPRETLVGDHTLLIGDSAGLANQHSGEGIRPAVESALIAAEAIAQSGDVAGNDLVDAYTERLDERFGQSSTTRLTALCPLSIRNWLGRQLLRSPRFVRNTVLDDWFLNRMTPALECRQQFTRRAALRAP